jgi:hypothetical protein
VFFTSAVRGVMPVASIDGVARAPGAATRAILTRYRARLARCAARVSLL